MRIDQLDPPNPKDPEHRQQMKRGRSFLKKARRTLGLDTSSLKLGLYGISFPRRDEDSTGGGYDNATGRASSRGHVAPSSVFDDNNYMPPSADTGRSPFD